MNVSSTTASWSSAAVQSATAVQASQTAAKPTRGDGDGDSDDGAVRAATAQGVGQNLDISA